LDMPDDDYAFQAVHIDALHRHSTVKRSSARASAHGQHIGHREPETEESKREDARHGLRGTFRKSASKGVLGKETDMEKTLSARQEVLREQDRRMAR